MGSYRRIIVDIFRRCKLKTAAPLQKFTSLSTTYSVISTCSNSRRSRISEFFQPVLRNSVLQNVVKNKQRYRSPFLDWFFQNLNSRKLLRTSLLGLLGFGAAYYWSLERVPYTKRSHCVLFSTSLEKKLTEWTFERIIEFEWKRLPPLHPSSIKVQRIGKEIVEAAQKGLRKEEESLMTKIFKKMGKRDYHQIPQFEWEFVVVDEPSDNAMYFAGGKFIIFTGWLHTFESDVEIVVMISHEVGHAIARHAAEMISRLPGHSAEKVSKLRCPLILKLFLYWKANLDLIPAISDLLIWLPYSRRREKEADCIGLNLMAAAGYDPRVVVKVLEYIAGVNAWPFEDYVLTHPCGKKRAKLLSQPKVMEEALSLYREVQAQGK